MRYWFHGEDEDFEREMERVRRFGGAEPVIASPDTIAALVFVYGVQVILLVALIGLLIVR